MVRVKVTEGLLEGETVTSDLGGTFYSFKGIPYATPPVGDLRFKAPVPPKSWEGVRSAKQHGNQCHQFNFVTRDIENGSEDCLYLNVYTPELTPTNPLPVMIWIHGGAFCCGNGNDDTYGPEFLIRHGVILVTINYRLEILGFLCLDTEDVPGNAGIKDQVAAMRWVKQNIASFGGDPDNITLFGQSAGGACVTYHCVSPMTKGLFRRGIAQSGNILISWAKSYRARERSIALAKKLGCYSEDDKELYEFFKNVSLDKICEVQVPLTYEEKVADKYETQYMIVSEKVFPNIEPYFTGDVIEALKYDIHEDIELILGYNEDDGSVILSVCFDMKNTVYMANHFSEYFVPKHMSLHCSTHDQLTIGGEVKKYYCKKKPLSVRNMEPLVKYFTVDYSFSSYQLAKFFAARNHNVYLYKFTCRSERNFYGKILGLSAFVPNKSLVSHIDDIAYLFPNKNVNLKLDPASDTFQMINNITKLWTNFAKTGNPTPDFQLGVNWRPFKVKSQYYLDLGNRLKRAINPEKGEFEFWEEIYKKYMPNRIYQDEEKENGI